MIDLYELTAYFNAATNSKYSPTSNRMVDAAERCNTLGISNQDIKDYYKAHPFDDLCMAMKQLGPSILQFKEEKELAEKSAMTDRVISEAGVSGALGIIEQTMAAIIANNVPDIVELMKKEAVKVIDEQYGPVRKTVQFVIPERSETAGIVDKNFETILATVMSHNNPLLVGPAGTGKSYTAEQVAKTLGVPFYSSNAVKEEFKLSGFIDASGKYQETDFYRAFTGGGVFLLDEMDASYPEALVDLNGALAGQGYPFPTGTVKAHPDFFFIGTANTWGTGASNEYVGRNQMDAATLDRFTPITVDYDPRVEDSLTADKDLLKFVRDFRAAVSKAHIQHIVSYRAITKMNDLKDNIDIKTLIKIALIKNMEPSDLGVIINDVPADNKYGTALKDIYDEMTRS